MRKGWLKIKLVHIYATVINMAEHPVVGKLY